MTTGARSFVSLGADVGGVDAYNATNRAVLALRRSLAQHCNDPLHFGSGVNEIGIVLRVDGAIKAWGETGVENLRSTSRGREVTADVMVPQSYWYALGQAQVYCNISAAVSQALAQVAERLEGLHPAFESGRFRSAYTTACSLQSPLPAEAV